MDIEMKHWIKLFRIKKCSFWYNLVQFTLVRIDNVRYCKICNTQLDKLLQDLNYYVLNNHKKSIAIVSLLIKDIVLEKRCFMQKTMIEKRKNTPYD